MKKRLLLFILIFLTFFSLSCKASSDNSGKYRKQMREFVISIAEYSRTINPHFIVIPQNGQCVAWSSDFDEDTNNSKIDLDSDYFSAINGTGREDTFYGGGNIDYTLTPTEDSASFQNWCDVFKNQTGADGNKITVLSIDYCLSSDAADSYSKNNNKGYISFAAPDRNLTVIPEGSPYEENSADVNYLSDAKNFLYLLNNDSFSSKQDFLNKVKDTNYDVIVMDAYFSDGTLFTASEISSLKLKKNGGKRLVISYMSIGEAEDYRWYFGTGWLRGIKPKRKPTASAPAWLDKENPEWEGNYKVRYWNKDWQKVIYGNNNSYTAKILNAGFDGVYLDIIDAYEYYENQ